MAREKKKAKELTIGEKVALIRNSEGKSQRALADLYGIGKTQVNSILKRKSEWLNAYEENFCSKRKRIKLSCSRFQQDVNALTFSWFQKAKFYLPINGPLLQEKARKFANLIGHKNFQGSNGWLDRFKKRHNIATAEIGPCGTTSSIDNDVIMHWKAKLFEIAVRFSPQNIFSVDDTEISYFAIPSEKITKDDKIDNFDMKSKEKIKASFCVNMNGKFEKAIIIEKHTKLKGFGDFKFTSLPVTWMSNRNGCVTSEIFLTWLKDFDGKMRKEERHVLLLLNNSANHPKDVVLTNVTAYFLPISLNSILQPLNLGIVQAIKEKCEKSILEIVRLKEDKGEDGSGVSKCVSAHDVVNSLVSAMQDISPEAVEKCFHIAGITRVNTHSEDYFIDNDKISSLDDEVANIEESVLEKYFQTQDKNISKTNDIDCNEAQDSALTSQITTFSSALYCVDQLRSFLLNKNADHLIDVLNDLKNGLHEMSSNSSDETSSTDDSSRLEENSPLIAEYFVSA